MIDAKELVIDQERQSELGEPSPGHPLSDLDSLASDRTLNAARDQAMLTIIQAYKDHPAADNLVEQYRSRVADTELDSVDRLESLCFRDMGRLAVLEASDERRLFSLIDRGLATYFTYNGLKSVPKNRTEELVALTAAFRAVMATSLRLVSHVARQQAASDSASLMDSVQDGVFGLATAAFRFDAQRGNRFSTYAVPWIWRSIMHGRAESCRAVRIPRRLHEEWLNLRKEYARLETKLEREPTLEDVASSLGMTVQQVLTIQQAGHSDYLPLDDDDRGRDYLLLAVDSGGDPEDKRKSALTYEKLISRIEAGVITTKEAVALSLRYGTYMPHLRDLMLETRGGKKQSYEAVFNQLDPSKPATLAMAAELLGCTRQNIAYVEKKAIASLRAEPLNDYQ